MWPVVLPHVDWLAVVLAPDRLPEGFQTLLYTATWPKKVRALANEFLKNPVTVHVGDTGNQLVASKNITQIVKVVAQRDKSSMMHKLLTAINSDEDGFAKKESAKILVFCGTKRYCDTLVRQLRPCSGPSLTHSPAPRRPPPRGVLCFPWCPGAYDLMRCVQTGVLGLGHPDGQVLGAGAARRHDAGEHSNTTPRLPSALRSCGLGARLAAPESAVVGAA